MKVIKFDKEKVEHCIDAYNDEHGKKPYLIMSNKTKELFPPVMSYSCNSVSCGDICISSSNTKHEPIDIAINGTKYISEDEIRKVSDWYGCKILIDDSLEFGEVHIG